jgi:hypothetical protein|tara:strand:- start:1762 stop:2031 length:270 start_codon:yes stop_codon:yes gene_type:complete
MDENKKSIIIHYLTEFILIGIGIGILVVLLFIKDFQFSWNIASLWVFLYNGILFTYWLWKNDSKTWEKAIIGSYFVLIEIIIAGSFVSF